VTGRARRDAPLVFHLIPHTHWDREWYLGAAAFTARLVPMLDELLDRLERDPSYRTFLLDGQTVLLRDYLTVRPEREPLVRRMVGDGRLQTGPWYVLADEQIPSGESLVRNLLIGHHDAERWGGRLDALYAPDTFGHPAALPMLAREFGMVHGALWRGLRPARTHGRDVVRWAGPDGRDVVLYHLPRDGYEVGAALSADREQLARAWPPLRRELVSRAATRHVAVLVGADHHAAHPDLPALRDALAALEAGNEVRVSRLDEFLAEVSGLGSRVSGGPGGSDRLEGRVRRGEARDQRPVSRDSRLPAITGELLGSYSREE
jgi:alpha-mannosidase